MLEIAHLTRVHRQETPTEALDRLGWFELEYNHDLKGKHFAYRTKESVIPEELILLNPENIYTWDDNYPKWLPFYIPVDCKDLESIELDFPGIVIYKNHDCSFKYSIGVRTDFYSSDFMIICIGILLYISAIPNIIILALASRIIRIIWLLARCQILQKKPLLYWNSLEDCTISDFLFSIFS
jgi:hypothetical protein